MEITMDNVKYGTTMLECAVKDAWYTTEAVVREKADYARIYGTWVIAEVDRAVYTAYLNVRTGIKNTMINIGRWLIKTADAVA